MQYNFDKLALIWEILGKWVERLQFMYSPWTWEKSRQASSETNDTWPSGTYRQVTFCIYFLQYSLPMVGHFLPKSTNVTFVCDRLACSKGTRGNSPSDISGSTIFIGSYENTFVCVKKHAEKKLLNKVVMSVTLDHKTSHKGLVFKIESKYWENGL